MAILACEIFTSEYCAASHLGGTIIARLSDGKIAFVPRGTETNLFRRRIADHEATEINAVMSLYVRQLVKDKYVTVHKHGHYIQIHNRPLGGKKSCLPEKTRGQSSLDF